MIKRSLLILATSVALLALPARAHAGLLNKSIDFVYVTATLGTEYEHLRFITLNGVTTKVGGSDTWGVAYGAQAGVRLGGLSVGLLFQRDSVTNGASHLNLDKLYAEAGMNVRTGPLIALFHVDFGWAVAEAPDLALHGFGGKLGAALDYYPIRILSIGVGADFDLQGYSLQNGYAAAYGTSLLFRVGLHI